jgi:hypothetical protein
VELSGHVCGVWAGDMEADVKALQNPNLSERERLSHRLLLAEKRILQGTLDSVRRYVPFTVSRLQYCCVCRSRNNEISVSRRPPPPQKEGEKEKNEKIKEKKKRTTPWHRQSPATLNARCAHARTVFGALSKASFPHSGSFFVAGGGGVHYLCHSFLLGLRDGFAALPSPLSLCPRAPPAGLPQVKKVTPKEKNGKNKLIKKPPPPPSKTQLIHQTYIHNL